MAKGWYARLVKKIQDDTIRNYENGNKDTALLDALIRRKLRVIERFSQMDSELVRQYQSLLFYRSKISDLLLLFAMDEDKTKDVFKLIEKINTAITMVGQTVEEVRDSEIYSLFYERNTNRNAGNKGKEKKEKEEDLVAENNNNTDKVESEDDNPAKEVADNEKSMSGDSQDNKEIGG